MTPRELFEMIKENCDGNAEEVIGNAVDLLNNLRNDIDNFTLSFDTQIENFAEDNNVCPVCGIELKTHTYKDPREYQGFEVEESITNQYCKIHGNME